MNIYEKMAAITAELGSVAKNLEVQVTKTSRYKAVSERDIIDAVKPLEAKYGVYSFPASREIAENELLTKEITYNGNTTKTNSLYLRIATVYRFVNVEKPEEYIETTVYGDGIDTGDKAPGKAMTYADKYALMKAYKISTGDDPDREASPERGYEPQFTPAAPKGETPTEPTPAPPAKHKKLEGFATPEQIEILAGVYEGENLVKLLKARDLGSIDDMTAEDAFRLIEKLKKAGKIK